jgi:general stress protein 26
MDKQIRDKIISFLGLQKSRLGVVSTVNEESKPESALVYYAFDENLSIYFATKDNSRKYENILKNKNVAFVVATENPPLTLQLEGTASVYNDTSEQKRLFEELVGLASSRHFSSPISQQSTGGLQFIKISPSWMRLGDFQVRKHGNTFEEVIL